MKYHALRRRIYRHELKQLVATIGQLGIMFATFFGNVLVPVFLILALLAVATIAENATTLETRIIYQAIYLAGIYAMIKIQANAILATPYRQFIKTLPMSRAQHLRSDLLLTIMAGNLVLLAPLALCFFMPDLDTLWRTRFFVGFAIMVLLTSQIALYRRTIPVFSLLLLPLAAYHSMTHLEVNSLNTLWLLTVGLELWLIDRLIPHWRSKKVNSYGTVILLFVTHRAVNALMRIAATLAILGCYSYLVSKRPDADTAISHLGLSFLISLLIGSYQFEIERFRSQYQYYLTDLPLTPLKRRLYELMPLLFLSSIAMVIYVSFTALLDVALRVTALWLIWQLLLTLLTAYSVVRLGKHYYLAPIGVTALVFLCWFNFV